MWRQTVKKRAQIEFQRLFHNNSKNSVSSWNRTSSENYHDIDHAFIHSTACVNWRNRKIFLPNIIILCPFFKDRYFANNQRLRASVRDERGVQSFPLSLQFECSLILQRKQNALQSDMLAIGRCWR